MDSDAVNVYITLTARALNPRLFIISRASSPESIDTLIRAGSDRVVSPYMVSGVRMARMALQPAVLEFVDMVNMAPDLRIEELLVAKGSSLAGRTAQEACSPHEGVMVLAVRNPLGGLLVPPRADTALHEGDVLGSRSWRHDDDHAGGVLVDLTGHHQTEGSHELVSARGGQAPEPGHQKVMYQNMN